MNYLYKGNIKGGFAYFWNREYVKTDVLAVEEVSDGIVMPFGYGCGTGVYDENGKYVSLSAERWVCSDSVMKDAKYDRLDEDVIYLSSFSTGHYGDVLIDDLSRLWYVLKNNTSQRLVYVSKSFDIQTTVWCFRILSYLGIKSEQLLRVTKPTRFRNVIVPQKSMIHDEYIHCAYLDIYETIWQKCSLKQSEWGGAIKIYLTRKYLRKKKEVGEAIFEDFFRMNGYTIVAPEKLSFEEQVVLFHNCEEVASIEGTHAHNIVFKGVSGKKYKQVILRKQSECIPRQMQLNRITDGEVEFIDVWREPFKGFPISHDRGPFLIEWNENIEQYAKDHNMIIPSNPYRDKWSNRVLYVGKCIAYAIKHNLKKVYICLKH